MDKLTKNFLEEGEKYESDRKKVIFLKKYWDIVDIVPDLYYFRNMGLYCITCIELSL